MIISSAMRFDGGTLEVARELLGKFLILDREGTTLSRMITEVEAYDGFDDKASHASKGKTKRTHVMFEEGGVWYVYLVYGMHEMLNVVVGPKDYPAAILIRGVEGIDGPGKLTKLYGINRSFNGKPAAKEHGLYIEDKGVSIASSDIQTTPRIGVNYAGPVWSQKEWRFVLNAEKKRRGQPISLCRTQDTRSGLWNELYSKAR